MADPMRGAGGASEAERLRDAPGAGTRQHSGGEQPPRQDSDDSEWSGLIDCLTKIGDDLKADEGSDGGGTLTLRLEAAVNQVRALWAQAKRSRSPIEDRLRQIEKNLDARIDQKPDNRSVKSTWLLSQRRARRRR